MKIDKHSLSISGFKNAKQARLAAKIYSLMIMRDMYIYSESESGNLLASIMRDDAMKKLSAMNLKKGWQDIHDFEEFREWFISNY